MHDAAEKGDVKTVKRLLAYGADVDARTTWTDPYAHNADDRPFGECPPDHGFTPLHFAAGSGYTEVMKLLLAKKAKVDARSFHGYTPLHWAAESGRTEVAEFLLSHRAEIKARDKDGATPLHMAVSAYHNKDIVQLLLIHGAKVNTKDNSGRTPLHVAVLSYYEGAVAEFPSDCAKPTKGSMP